MKFLKRNNGGIKKLHPFITKVIYRFNNILKSFAIWLQEKTKGYSSVKIKVILFLFCTSFVGGNLFVIYHSITKKDRNFYAVMPIRPLPLLKEKNLFHPLISVFEFKRIHRYKILLDSLQKNNRIKFDSLLSNRPCLTDTINLLENLYYEQQSVRK
jgi:hypothetical protein